ncbi:MAG: HAD-IIIA family hydrolase [Phycisphaerales bacterium]|nr:MAG: HAD-IIIA family hydrolase [Phycisphaerales bacterium]
MSDKAIFLDRDDTLIEDPGYINTPEQVKLLDGVPEALIALKTLGFKLVVVTNQSAVARGIVTEKVLDDIHERLKELLARKNAFLDAIYYCPYHPDGVVPQYRKESDSRKPNPGMLQKAAEEMDLDLSQSWCLGNSSRDVEAGRRAGCMTILIDKPSHQPSGEALSRIGVAPDHRAVNIKEAVNIIKKHLRSAVAAKAQTQPVLAAKGATGLRADETAGQIPEPAIHTESHEQTAERAEPIIRPPESKVQAGEPSDTDRPESEAQRPEPDVPAGGTDALLTSILTQLKTMQRDEMFGEFSVMRLIAGVVQIIVLFCLLVTVWFLMSPERQDSSVFIALGFAIVFQLMALTFYIMQGRK